MMSFKKIFSVFTWFNILSLWKKITIFVLIVVCAWFLYPKLIKNKSQQVQYQTTKVEKGTLIVTLSASGQVTETNSASVTTQTSGVVKKIFVKNGQDMKSGDAIAEIDLDMDGKQRASQALASYQSAKNSLDSARVNLYTLQSTMLTDWKTYMDTAQSSLYESSDGTPKTSERQLPEYMSIDDDWLAAEAKYKNQQNVIAQAQTSVNSSWATYQKSSPIIYAPISGKISGLSLQIGSILTAQTGSSGNSASQRIANIKTAATPMISVNLTEIDAPKVKIDDKVTITLDALPDKTFTGKVVSIDTTGAVSSGVTTYPSVIKLDTGDDAIFPNMAAQANIITQVKNDILMVPISAVQNQNGTDFVRVMNNGQVREVQVEKGISSSIQTEIISGLSEGEIVVTSIINPPSGNTGVSQSQTSSSPFSSFGGNRGGGGFVRVRGD